MKFLFIFYMLGQTTLSIAGGLKCYQCDISDDLNDYNECLAKPDAKFSEFCSGADDLCYVYYYHDSGEIGGRLCLDRWLLRDHDNYVLNGCRQSSKFPKSTNCLYDTNNSNDRTSPSQIASLNKDFKCITCKHDSSNIADCALTADPSYSYDCTGKDFICVTILNSTKQVRRRECATPTYPLNPGASEPEYLYYSLDECKTVNGLIYCACQTINCNNKMPSELPLPTEPIEPVKPDREVQKLMCYQCEGLPACSNPTDTLLKPCPRHGYDLFERGAGEEYYCTTKFFNGQVVSRDCKSRSFLLNYKDPAKCHIHESTKFCACKYSKCNRLPSLTAETNHVGANNGSFIAILISSVVLILLFVKWQAL